MRVLVVGGAGYIGSVVTQILVERGIETVVFDDLSKGHAQALPEESVFVKGSTANRADLEKAFSHKVDAVMHFAAFINVGESVQVPAKYFQNNLANSLSLFDAMIEHGVKSLIFSSTAAVYGETDKWPITEDFPLNPTNPYGESKLAVENVLKWYARAYDLRYATLRYFNAAGAYKNAGEDHFPETHLIPLALEAAVGTREKLTIFGEDYSTPDGTCVRDYVHVADLADAHVKALQHLSDGGAGGVFNVGNGAGMSVKEVVASVERVTGKKVPIEVGPRRAGDPARLVASSEKICKVLNWRPQHAALDNIVADAWNWKQNHPNGYAAKLLKT